MRFFFKTRIDLGSPGLLDDFQEPSIPVPNLERIEITIPVGGSQLVYYVVLIISCAFLRPAKGTIVDVNSVRLVVPILFLECVVEMVRAVSRVLLFPLPDVQY